MLQLTSPPAPSATVAPAAPSAAHTSESFSAFLSAVARRASDSLSASIAAHSVLEVPRGRGGKGRRGAAAPAAPLAVGTRTSARLIGKPQRSHSRKLPTLRVRLTNALAHSGPTESTVLLEEPETLDAELLQEEEAEAKAEAERTRPGLIMFTDGSRLDDGATGYSVVWKRGLTWAGAKVHMGKNQEAYDAECVALAHALELAAQRSTTPERVTIFSDAQAAIRRMASGEPGPEQQYALQARKHIARLRRARKGIVVEIRWCPAHKGVGGNEKADEWAKIAAGEPNTRGVEWLSPSGRTEVRAAPLPRSLANLKREISEKKWAEARQWAGGRTSKAKYRMPKSQKPDGVVSGSTKRLASRYYQLKTGHARTGPYTCTGRRSAPMPSAGGASAPRKRETTSSRCVRSGRCSRRFCGRRC